MLLPQSQNVKAAWQLWAEMIHVGLSWVHELHAACCIQHACCSLTLRIICHTVLRHCAVLSPAIVFHVVLCCTVFRAAVQGAWCSTVWSVARQGEPGDTATAAAASVTILSAAVAALAAVVLLRLAAVAAVKAGGAVAGRQPCCDIRSAILNHRQRLHQAHLPFLLQSLPSLSPAVAVHLPNVCRKARQGMCGSEPQ
jgi:hypothetical protein